MDKQQYFALILIKGAIGDYASKTGQELDQGWYEANEESNNQLEILKEKNQYFFSDNTSIFSQFKNLWLRQDIPSTHLFNLMLGKLTDNYSIDQRQCFTKEEIIEAANQIIAEWLNPHSHPEKKG